MAPTPEERDRISYRAVELYLSTGNSVPALAKALSAEFQVAVSREGVYHLLKWARKRGFVRIVPPLVDKLRDALCARFALPPDSVRVVVGTTKPFGRPGEDPAAERVAFAAAERVLQIVKSLSPPGSRRVVGLGLGPGGTTLEFSRMLGAMLEADKDAPRLSLFALTAGAPANRPEQSPVSFFNLFPETRISSRVGLFAETLVPAKMLDTIKNRPGVQEAFAARGQIDVIVTSMGDMDDEHDLLTDYLTSSRIPISQLRSLGWVGNAQYRPFTATGPAPEKPEFLRAVTLFELNELCGFAATRGKYVVLVARPCRLCGHPRARAMLSLLREPSLRVFTELVIDEQTAIEVLRLSESSAPA
jgi:DNA-binding transcriptional regulator LsrR (DeoR family)